MSLAPGRRIVVAALTVVALLPAAARAQSRPATAMDDRWHFFVAPYLWGAGMEGRVGVNDPLSVPVDLSFGDALENLDFALLGRFEARKNRFGFGVDVSYLNLGVEVTGPVDGQLGLGADARTLTLEAVATYRVAHDDSGRFVDLLAGVRWLDNRAQLTIERGGESIPGSEREVDWVDALAGARFRLPLGGTLALHGRGDVAGFGSDFSWNLQGGLDVRLGEQWKVGAGYRYLDVDYDSGELRERRIWQITYQGPYAFVGYAW